jgi:hypothetical protein
MEWHIEMPYMPEQTSAATRGGDFAADLLQMQR